MPPCAWSCRACARLPAITMARSPPRPKHAGSNPVTREPPSSSRRFLLTWATPHTWGHSRTRWLPNTRRATTAGITRPRRSSFMAAWPKRPIVPGGSLRPIRDMPRRRISPASSAPPTMRRARSRLGGRQGRPPSGSCCGWLALAHEMYAQKMQPRSHEDTKHARRMYSWGFLRGFVFSWQKMWQPRRTLRFRVFSF